MNKISVILPVNNKEMFSQEELDTYQTDDTYYELSLIDTPLTELNSAEDGQAVIQPTIDKVVEAEKNGAKAAIVLAFGDVAVKEAGRAVQIPVIGTGTYATHVASEICDKGYTVLPGMRIHNQFIQQMVSDINLGNKFVLCDDEVGLSPSQIRMDPELTVERLFNSACSMIDEHGVDALTMGCTCFMGMAKPLQARLNAHYQGQKKCIVIDPGEVAFSLARLIA